MHAGALDDRVPRSGSRDTQRDDERGSATEGTETHLPPLYNEDGAFSASLAETETRNFHREGRL
jgi:hypothetical protein